MTDLPSGTVTFLFTDIEGSTALWERDQPAVATAVDRHLELLDTAIASHHGIHFKTVGDAVQALPQRSMPSGRYSARRGLSVSHPFGSAWPSIPLLRIHKTVTISLPV